MFTSPEPTDRAESPHDGRPSPGANDRLQTLRAFGLSEYAARAYLALLELGTTEARDVSRLARVPIAKVYSTLDQLGERGLVVVEPGPPKRFTPAPFSVFLHRKRERLAAESRNLERAAVELAEVFPIRGAANADDRATFLTMRGRENVIEKLQALSRESQREILVLGADGSAKHALIEPLLADASARGIEVRTLAPSPSVPTEVAMAVFDGRRLAIVHFVPDDGARFEGKDVAIVIEEAAMAKALHEVLRSAADSGAR